MLCHLIDPLYCSNAYLPCPCLSFHHGPTRGTRQNVTKIQLQKLRPPKGMEGREKGSLYWSVGTVSDVFLGKMQAVTKSKLHTVNYDYCVCMINVCWWVMTQNHVPWHLPNSATPPKVKQGVMLMSWHNLYNICRHFLVTCMKSIEISCFFVPRCATGSQLAFDVVELRFSLHLHYTGTRRIHKIHRSEKTFEAVSNSIGGGKQSTARSWEKNSMASWSYTSCFSRIMATLGDFMDASICHGIDREWPEVADTVAAREKAMDEPCPCNLLRSSEIFGVWNLV